MITRAAGIDIGSNSFRLIIAEISTGIMRILHKDLVTVRLGKGLGQTGHLSATSIDDALDTLLKFKKTMIRFGSETCRACGTYALRKAANANDFIVPASNILQVEIEILSGNEEALLSYRGAQAFLPQNLGRQNVLIFIDIGGGSTEFVFSQNNGNEEVLSLDIGAVALTESCLCESIPSADEINTLSREVKKGLAPFVDRISKLEKEVCLIASGGTATALAAIALNIDKYDAEAVQNYFLDKDKLDDLFNFLKSMPSARRNRIPGLEDKRGEIILAGTKILQTIIDHCRVSGITVSDAGLLEGIVLGSIR